jgi:purine nucleosidase/pyrimidine-specific ribonucleoside hydrolase
MARPVVIDCDPGHDDALAILLAAGSPEVELLAITTVAGNQTLDRTTLNARRVCSLAGLRDVPVAAGCDRPLLRPLVVAADVHGESGLDGPAWPEPAVAAADVHAVDLIVERVTARPGEVTLVAIGPLTNLAMAVRREPRLARLVREVVLMGGSTDRGNVTPAAEFNVFVDPEAAAIVFDAGWPLTMVGLNLTRQAPVTAAVARRIEAVGTPAAATVTELLGFYGRRYRDRPDEGPPLHDPCAVARVIHPAVVACREAFVAVETEGRWTAGATVVDLDGRLERPPNARVATTLDAPAFWDLLLAALARLPGSLSPGPSPP